MKVPTVMGLPVRASQLTMRLAVVVQILTLGFGVRSVTAWGVSAPRRQSIDDDSTCHRWRPSLPRQQLSLSRPFPQYPFPLNPSSSTLSVINTNDEIESASASSSLDVVLFGVGDLRLDDHVGLARALEHCRNSRNGHLLPLLVLDHQDILHNIPGAVAHTVDTARLLASAVRDLHDQLETTLGLVLHNVPNRATAANQDLSLTATIREVIETYVIGAHREGINPNGLDVRVHVHDLGLVDNILGYGAYHHLQSELGGDSTATTTSFELVPWNSNLRDDPWEDVKSLPNTFPAFETRYVSLLVNAPVSMPTNALAGKYNGIVIPSLQHLPNERDLVNRFVDIFGLDRNQIQEEVNTGLYQTHWGGLDPASATTSTVRQRLETYGGEACRERDDIWFAHEDFVGRNCPANERSLEHASMLWQLRGENKPSDDAKRRVWNSNNWLAGESMVRYLSAPLLLGTVSPRRVWHTSSYESAIFVSPLKRLVEGREWHRLLAARNILTEEAYRNDTTKSGDITKSATMSSTYYRYWRYHGFLCRYAVTDFHESSSTTILSEEDKEGVVLVHGFGASGSQWNKAMMELKLCVAASTKAGPSTTTASQGLAPDLIGFGEAEKPALSYSGYMWDSQVLDFVKERAMAVHGCTSFVTGGNSIGGFTSMSLAASDAADVDGRSLSSSGAPGTQRCTGLVLMNSAGPVKTLEEASAETTTTSIAVATVKGRLPICKPPARPVARLFGNVLLGYLRPRIQSICKNLYPTNPAAVDESLCTGIFRDSLDPGAINVMMAGAKLPPPRSANELLKADFGRAATVENVEIPEAFFDGPVLVAQGVLDPLNDSTDRMNRFGALRAGITKDPINAGHCPHDELPGAVAQSISNWMVATRTERILRVPSIPKTAQVRK